MAKHLIFVLVAAVLATPLAAQTPMDADAFEAYSQGKTLYFGYNGTLIGAEEYRPNRRVRWSARNGDCKDGTWYPDGQMICFLYEGNPDPQCWSFYQQNAGLTAQYENDPDQPMVSEMAANGEPMICLGPEIGV
ncbi:hypothetical protein JI58_00540 [Marinosulfonomonas sp. PRT-SC04]|nr:hypothetical protein JI58_00540 [Marinosulfonomonas sp. PRT-SC04]